MDIVQFIAQFFYRIRYWLLWGGFIVTVLVAYFTQFLPFSYTVNSNIYAGVTNVGTRPTVSDSGSVSIETFLLDFASDLYGKRIRLEFCRRLREEKKFDTPQQLKDEIEKNIAQTREYFREMGEE